MTQPLPANDPDKDSARLIGGSSGIDEPKRWTNPGFLAQQQRAEVSFKATKEAGLNARAEITNGGLLSVAVLVSSILLSTAVLVHAARKNGKSKTLW